MSITASESWRLGDAGPSIFETQHEGEIQNKSNTIRLCNYTAKCHAQIMLAFSN